jgi:hypothetical protein
MKKNKEILNKDNNNNNININILMNFFSKLFYKCKTCEFSICYLCKDINDFSFMTIQHEHPLDLNLNKNFWLCNNRDDEEEICPMGINSFEFQINEDEVLTRFSCFYCDFNLCEFCLEKYLMI